MEVKVIDNFLDQSTFKDLEEFIMGEEFPWYFNPRVVFEDEKGNIFQFTHMFYREMGEGYQTITSNNFKLLTPITKKLRIKVLIRVKANLLTQTSKKVETEFHIDLDPYTMSSGRKVLSSSVVKKLKPYTTSILYMNTNNGYTKFEDGTIVKSEANRMVTFPASMRHLGATCTDQQSRVVINFNYIK